MDQKITRPTNNQRSLPFTITFAFGEHKLTEKCLAHNWLQAIAICARIPALDPAFLDAVPGHVTIEQR